jgi:hypothetical protein
MDQCPECKALDEALSAAAARRDAAARQVAPFLMSGNQPRTVYPEALEEQRESNNGYAEIRAKRTAHIKDCAHLS